MDNPEDQIYVHTFLSTRYCDPKTARLKDLLISRVVEVSVVLTWHGIWTLTDLLTKNIWRMSLLESSFVTLILGYTGGLLLFIIQFPLLRLAHSKRKLARITRPLAIYIFTLLGVFVTISRWAHIKSLKTYVYTLVPLVVICFLQFSFLLVSVGRLLSPWESSCEPFNLPSNRRPVVDIYAVHKLPPWWSPQRWFWKRNDC